MSVDDDPSIMEWNTNKTLCLVKKIYIYIYISSILQKENKINHRQQKAEKKSYISVKYYKIINDDDTIDRWI